MYRPSRFNRSSGRDGVIAVNRHVKCICFTRMARTAQPAINCRATLGRLCETRPGGTRDIRPAIYCRWIGYRVIRRFKCERPQRDG
jgi:hypothetical protein